MKQQFYAKKKISSTYKNEWLKFILQEDTLWGARESKFNKLESTAQSPCLWIIRVFKRT